MSFKEIIKNIFMNKGDNKMKEIVEFLHATSKTEVKQEASKLKQRIKN